MTRFALQITFNKEVLVSNISAVFSIFAPHISARRQIAFAASFGIYERKSLSCNERDGASFHISLLISPDLLQPKIIC